MNENITAAVGSLPPHMIESLQRYIERRILPGGFLTSVLKGDLFLAIGLADMYNLPLIPFYVVWLLRNAPIECFGSPETVRDWVNGGAK